MPYIDVSRIIADVDPFDLSASVAERGCNAGPETWTNAKAEVESRPLITNPDERESVRDYFGEFGAWDDVERAAWSAADIDALTLQYAAGDLRELQSLYPGDGLAGVDWEAAEEGMREGRVSGTLFPGDDGRLYVCMGI